MTLNEVRRKYLHFFEMRNHAVIASASLVPERDPTTLFTGSGMQPLVAYLLGQQHPSGKLLVDSQKCFRSEDIEAVGDNRHTTFFEMLGNWSLGDPEARDGIGAGYFKEDQLSWLFQFLVDEIKLEPKKIYATVFAGAPKYKIPKDSQSAALWKKLFARESIIAKDVELGSLENASKVGMQNGRIFYYDAGKNWWSRAGVPENMPAGEPGGPDSEVFYDFGTPHDEKFGAECHPNCDCGRFMEIGNSVFMEYRKTEKGFDKLAQKNVDFGGGLERITAASNDNPDIFKIDLFSGIIAKLERLSGLSYDDRQYTKSFRIIADHLRASVFIIGDGVMPSNSERGYFVRRLLRRAIRHFDILGIPKGVDELAQAVIDFYKDFYPSLLARQDEIRATMVEEEKKFRRALDVGLKEFKKIAERTEKISNEISGKDAFMLFSSYGLPIDVIAELALQNTPKALFVAVPDFEKEFKTHQEISRAGTEKKFKGGLSDTSDMSLKYHTATHLLHQALRDVLGSEVQQKGSNITPERLRFDFAFSRKMTDEEKQKVEDIVNEKIQAAMPVNKIILPREEAEKTDALHFFGEKYGEQVSVYYIGGSLETAYSKEFCGGPHVENTAVLGKFKILKEEAVSAGARRIKAVLA